VKAPKEHFEFNFKIAFGICQRILDCFGGLVDFSRGGKKVIERLVEAYGFTTRQALCDHLGVSKSTMATRYMRDIFPADWVLQCAIETGSSLEWLSFGTGTKDNLCKDEMVVLERKNLINGKLCEDDSLIFDKKLLPKVTKDLIVVTDNGSDFICNNNFDSVRDGRWLIKIDEDMFIRTITRLPNRRIFIDGGNRSFECEISEVKIIAKVIISCVR